MDKKIQERLAPFAEFIAEAAEKFNIRAELICAIIAVESAGISTAKAPTTTASGLMQLTKAAAQDMGLPWEKRYDPRENIMAGTGYLAMLINRNYGDERRGVMAYYAGHGTINDDKETQLDKDAEKYADKVYSQIV